MNTFTHTQRRSLAMAVLLVTLILAAMVPAPGALAQFATDDRIETVTSTATEISRQRENGDWFDLYDRMHPSARNLLPRQALVNWAESGELSIPSDDPTIGEVTFGAWRWNVTGEIFMDAATVQYTQSVERNGSVIEESGEWVFVDDGQRWRWFPELSADEMSTLTATVGAETNAYLPTFRRAAYVRIDRFWENVFTESELDYEAMTDIVAITSQPFETGCGIEEEIELYAIYYCTLDATVYYDPGFQEDVVDLTGPYGFTTIIAHEWGHHIQVLLGIDISLDPELDGGLYPIEIELQADCLAGIYAQDALAIGDIDEEEIEAAIEITSLSGDTADTEFVEFDAHGTGDQRIESFSTGFDDGFIGCNLDLDDYAN